MFLTPWFWLLALIVVLVFLATYIYIKLDIEPVTEEMRKWQDRIRGYRTQAFAALVAVAGLVSTFEPGMIIGLFGPSAPGPLIVLVALCIWGLRRITTTPPGLLKGNTTGK